METVLEIPRTKVQFDFPFRLDPDKARIASCGSCFAENVTELLAAAGIACERNPNGILYNPHSLAKSLLHVMNDQPYTETDFFEYNGLWHGWEHHGSFSSQTLSSALEKAENARIQFRDFLKKADLLILTPATAVVFEVLEKERIAANCHKLPGTRFKRRLLTSGEASESLCSIAETLKRFNPACKLVFTLSPVRHNPGELILNTRSKAIVLNAIHECVERYSDAVYFPAYEIVMDELRDYRFFRDDMLHPGDFAVKQVAYTFASACFGPEFLSRMNEAEKTARQSRHIDKRSL